MTKEKLEARRTVLQAEFERVFAQLEVLRGAIHDCNYWLSELEKPADPVTPSL